MKLNSRSQEEFYMEQNVEKAIEIDEWSADTLTTSMVDDAFFVLQKCGRRALATGVSLFSLI